MNPLNKSKIFFNPNFKKANSTHINPNFLLSTTNLVNAIYVNPAFLSKFKSSETSSISEKDASSLSNHLLMSPLPTTTCKSVNNQPKIISKSRTKIVRESSVQKNLPSSTALKLTNNSLKLLPCEKQKLIKIGTKKLIRQTNNICKSTIKLNNAKLFLKENVDSLVLKGKYKLERKCTKLLSNTKPSSKTKKQIFISRYALSRGNLNENLSVIKFITNKKLTKINNAHKYIQKALIKNGSVNKKFEMVNINGVLYKSTKNKLQKTSTNSKTILKMDKSKSVSRNKSIYIRGDKFVLDKSGLNLTRVTEQIQDNPKLKRIDIGGLTYVAKSNNVFIRTNTHKTRNHLSLAKQKSINLLSKNLKKTNITCPIYQKLGKCAGFENGRCPKVHEKKQINICPKYLKGECNNDKCLLSHEVTLSKMPTCKFFLQGCCVRDDCPYLHKKLNEKTDICPDFLKGFCDLAEKCDKRHEFLCPDFESTGKCEKLKCPYCRLRDKKATFKKHNRTNKTEDLIHESTTVASNESEYEIIHENEEKQDLRYFEKEIFGSHSNVSNDNSVLQINNVLLNSDGNYDEESDIIYTVVSKRPKLGDLPAYIPL